MKHSFAIKLFVLLFITSLCRADQRSPFLVTQQSIKKAFNRTEGCFIMITRSTGNMICFNPQGCLEKLAPFSTFKIWNTLIGFETGLLEKADDSFYKWDGETRFIPEWNKDLTLREAFTVSCVPAFQELARKIGEEKMQFWINKLNYGDHDISLGIDRFWIPKPGEKSILISPLQQAELILALTSGKLPVSKQSEELLEDLMRVREDEEFSIYGKTGSGIDENGKFNMGWFVGYLRRNRDLHAFACVVKGFELKGKDARVLVEAIFEKAVAKEYD